MEEIRSASTDVLTSQNLSEIKRLILTAYEEHEKILSELSKAREEENRAVTRFQSWDKGFFLKRLFKGSFDARRAEFQIACERKCELEEQLRLTTVATQVELEAEQVEPFFKMRDDFAALSTCAAIWDIKAQKDLDRIRERTAANKAVNRQKVKFSLGHSDLITWNQPVPHLQNANGGDLFLYPGFLLYRAARTAFSVIDFHDLCVKTEAVKFQEEDGVPADSEVVDQTWAKTNKDGGRDRRFANNYEIPIALYGGLTLKSSTGLWEEFQFSSPQKLARFAASLKEFVDTFGPHVSVVVNADDIGPRLDSEKSEAPLLAGSVIHFECLQCHQPIDVNADAAGQEFRCPSCGSSLVVPER